jgi:hypothetical protein
MRGLLPKKLLGSRPAAGRLNVLCPWRLVSAARCTRDSTWNTGDRRALKDQRLTNLVELALSGLISVEMLDDFTRSMGQRRPEVLSRFLIYDIHEEEPLRYETLDELYVVEGVIRNLGDASESMLDELDEAKDHTGPWKVTAAAWGLGLVPQPEVPVELRLRHLLRILSLYRMRGSTDATAGRLPYVIPDWEILTPVEIEARAEFRSCGPMSFFPGYHWQQFLRLKPLIPKLAEALGEL